MADAAHVRGFGQPDGLESPFLSRLRPLRCSELGLLMQPWLVGGYTSILSICAAAITSRNDKGQTWKEWLLEHHDGLET